MLLTYPHAVEFVHEILFPPHISHPYHSPLTLFMSYLRTKSPTKGQRILNVALKWEWITRMRLERLASRWREGRAYKIKNFKKQNTLTNKILLLFWWKTIQNHPSVWKWMFTLEISHILICNTRWMLIGPTETWEEFGSDPFWKNCCKFYFLLCKREWST